MASAVEAAGTTVTRFPEDTRWRRMFLLTPQSITTTCRRGAAGSPPGRPSVQSYASPQVTSFTRSMPTIRGEAASLPRKGCLVEVSAGDDAVLRALQTQVPRQGPSIHALDPHHAPFGEPGRKVDGRAPVRPEQGDLPDDEAGEPRPAWIRCPRARCRSSRSRDRSWSRSVRGRRGR